MDKLVTVYIPTKNRPELLGRAIRSVVSQSYHKIELIICDDGSDVDLSQVIRSYEDKVYKLRFIRNDTSIGASASRNLMINSAEGEYITGLDDDDEFLPNRVEQFVQHGGLDKYSFLTTPYLTYTGKRLLKSSQGQGEIHLNRLLNGNVVGNQIFTLTSRLKGIGGFDPTFPSWQDYDTWVRFVSKYGKGYKLSAATYKYNIDHEIGRISSSTKAKDGYLMFIEKHKDLLNEENRKFLYFRDLINRRGQFEWGDLIKNITLATTPLMLKFAAKKVILKT